MASGNFALGLKHHILNGRLSEAKKVLAVAQIPLEEVADDDQNTPLHWCAQGLEVEASKREASESETLAFLLQNGAPKNRQNMLGETPLLTAVKLAVIDETRAITLVQDMLKHGADASRPDNVGETPLMEAAVGRYLAIGRLLLEHRANPLAESAHGHTALSLLEGDDSEDFVALLEGPLAVRAAREAQESSNEDAGETAQERQQKAEVRFEQKAKLFNQTLFGQKLRPGLAKDQDKAGKPYPEYGTLHDID
mmetsp:Transcript_49658/g.91691  ORF Transcript_49658/g.91691 Transcript_49658/m.91691 type:complete len:252 (-) Transcript_49658:84-839(-)